MHLRLPRLIATLAVAGALAGAAAAATNPGPPAIDASATAGQLDSARAVTVTGTITCTKYAHYHLGAWVEQPDRGALGKGSIPPKLSPKLSPKSAKAAVAHWRTLTACTGAAQPWSLTLPAVGLHPIGFATGTAHVCLIAYASKGHLYSLSQSCADITLP
jgi:hypothetical protein